MLDDLVEDDLPSDIPPDLRKGRPAPKPIPSASVEILVGWYGLFEDFAGPSQLLTDPLYEGLELFIGQAGSATPPSKLSQVLDPVVDRSRDCEVVKEVPGIPVEKLSRRFLLSPPSHRKTRFGIVQQTLGALLLAVQGDEPGHKQTTDDRHQRGTGARDRGQERGRVAWHLRRLPDHPEAPVGCRRPAAKLRLRVLKPRKARPVSRQPA
jgi:hypothetical protein